MLLGNLCLLANTLRLRLTFYACVFCHEQLQHEG